MNGIKFKMKDGSCDYYDPLNTNDLSETNTHYTLNMTYLYDIPKDEVEYFEWYDLCEDCGHDIFDDGCRRCTSERELEQLKKKRLNYDCINCIIYSLCFNI